MSKKYGLDKYIWVSVVIMAAVLIGIGLYAWHTDQGTSANSNTQAQLIFADSAKGQVYITNDSSQQLSSYSFVKNSYLGFEANDASGDVLFSLNANTPGESFMLLKSGSLKSLPTEVVQRLRLSVTVGASANLYLADSNTALTVACTDPNSTCVLESVNLTSGEATPIVDSGVAQTDPNSPQVFLVGYSAGARSAYLRVIGANKLGNSTSAVYRIDINSKQVTGSYSVPQSAGYAIAVSPDNAKLAYHTPGQSTTVHVLNMSDGQDQNVTINSSSLANLAGAIRWSPDSQKLLVQTQGKTSASPTQSVFISLSKKSVTTLQQIDNSSLGIIYYQDWLDNANVIYQTITTGVAYNYANTNSNTLTFQQNVFNKMTANFNSPGGNLLQVFQIPK